MYVENTVGKITRRRILAVLSSVFPVFIACPSMAYPQDKSGFPEGYDAVQAAPNSHKVIFECIGPCATGHRASAGHNGTDASPSLAEFLLSLGYRRQDSACSLHSPGC